MKIAIIEDELPAAKRLESLLHRIRPEVEIIGHADSIEDACELLANSSPDLVFLDIQLADGLSFSIFDRIELRVPVVFISAHDQYAIRAFKVNSIDYLLKPVNEEELISAVEKFEGQHIATRKNYQSLFEAFASPEQNYRNRFLVKSGANLSFVTTEQVAWLVSEAGVTFLVTHGNDRFMLASSLDELEKELDPTVFFRINRACIVALTAIRKIEPYLNHRLLLHLEPLNDEHSLVSRHRVSEFKQWLDGR